MRPQLIAACGFTASFSIFLQALQSRRQMTATFCGSGTRLRNSLWLFPGLAQQAGQCVFAQSGPCTAASVATLDASACHNTKDLRLADCTSVQQVASSKCALPAAACLATAPRPRRWCCQLLVALGPPCASVCSIASALILAQPAVGGHFNAVSPALVEQRTCFVASCRRTLLV